MNLLKRTIPLIIAFVMGVMMAGQYYVPSKGSQDLLEVTTRWDRIIAGFAVFIGAYSLLHLHWGKIKQKVAGWAYSVFVFIGTAGTVAFGLYNGGKFFWNDKQENTMFDWIYSYIQVPAGATIFSILAFFIASSAYRTFRARTWESTVLLITAVLVMIGRVPIGSLVSPYIPVVLALFLAFVAYETFQSKKWVSILLFVIATILLVVCLPVGIYKPQYIYTVADWIMAVPNLAAKRGILLGVSLGAIATSLKIIFGIERAYLGGDE